MTRLQSFAGLIVYGYLSWAVPARADAVADWDAIAIQAIVAANPPHPGPTGFLDIAVVHAAVYDAVESIDGRFQPYHLRVPEAHGSPAAAAARAAHDVLVNRFPEQTASVDAIYHDYLSKNGLCETDPGVAVGQQTAAAIIALRAKDGSFPNPNPPPPPFLGGTDPGIWRPTISYLPGPPPSLSPMLAPWLAKVTPFTLTSPSQFRPGPPPALTSCRYARDYNEVKALGSLVNSARTFEQTDLGYFYADNFLVLWHQGLRDIANTYLSKIGDSARLFALVSLAMADAGIATWDAKRHYVFWRPVTAIQEGDNDGNPRTLGESSWQPLTNTPPYPEYTSGANGVNRAATRMLALFFGTDYLTFSLTSGNPNAVQKTRTYSRLSEQARDVVNARIYEGIHFRTADLVGRRLGWHVANWAFYHFLRPVCGND